MTRNDLTFVSSRVENNSTFGPDGYARPVGRNSRITASLRHYRRQYSGEPARAPEGQQS